MAFWYMFFISLMMLAFGILSIKGLQVQPIVLVISMMSIRSLFVDLKWNQWICLPSSTFGKIFQIKQYLHLIDSFFLHSALSYELRS